jgi:DNA-binding NarL/FixJ family response regulator
MTTVPRRSVDSAKRHGRPEDVALVCRPQLLRLGLEHLFTRAGFRVTSHPSVFTPPRPAVVGVICERDITDLDVLCRQALGTLGWELVVVFHAPTPDTVLDCLAAGVRGFVAEHDAPRELAQAVTAAATGDYHLAQGMLALLLDWHRARRRPRSDRTRERDRDLLALLAAGDSTTAIAARLGVAPKTVRNRASLLYRRLGVRSRSEAARIAEERGLLD